MLTLTFLGTSSGVPTRARNVTSLAVHTGPGRDWWMVDCGEATQHQLQRTPLSVHDLVGICITHVHGDHSYGLPGILASAAMTGRKRPLLMITPQAIRAWIEATITHTELFLPYTLEFIDVDSVETVYSDQQLSITRHLLSHRARSHAFRFALEHRSYRLNVDALRAIGLPPGPAWKNLQEGATATLEDGRELCGADYRIETVQRTVAVVAGDNDTPALLADACKDAQLLVHEATYTEAMLRKVGPGPTHSSVQRVAQFAAAVPLPNLILTHFSARYHHAEGMAELETEARAHFSGQLFLADDFASFELAASGTLKRLDSPAG